MSTFTCRSTFLYASSIHKPLYCILSLSKTGILRNCVYTEKSLFAAQSCHLGFSWTLVSTLKWQLSHFFIEVHCKCSVYFRFHSTISCFRQRWKSTFSAIVQEHSWKSDFSERWIFSHSLLRGSNDAPAMRDFRWRSEGSVQLLCTSNWNCWTAPAMTGWYEPPFPASIMVQIPAKL
jgi:hypothetical protein